MLLYTGRNILGHEAIILSSREKGKWGEEKILASRDSPEPVASIWFHFNKFVIFCLSLAQLALMISDIS